MSYIGSYNDSGVEFQSSFVLLMDLLLAFGSNFSFRLQSNKHTEANHDICLHDSHFPVKMRMSCIINNSL